MEKEEVIVFMDLMEYLIGQSDSGVLPQTIDLHTALKGIINLVRCQSCEE